MSTPKLRYTYSLKEDQGGMQSVLVFPEAIELFSEDWKRECNFQSIPIALTI